jgi:uncharacterized membrane protein YfcA
VIDLSFVVVAVVAFGVATLTLFSGFGLGTLLMPAFAIFFPVEVAVAATAVVHALNNLFKVSLLYCAAAPRVLVVFGLPAAATALIGAIALAELSRQAPLYTWDLGPKGAAITPLKLVMGGLILVFAMFDLVPALQRFRVGPRWLPLGGALSGFFGGLSGHQGALRAAFLGRLGLSPASFAATQAVLACMVDASRLLVYGTAFFAGRMAGLATREEWAPVAVAAVFAFGGTFLGTRLLHRVTVRSLRTLTGSLLPVVALGLGSGLL